MPHACSEVVAYQHPKMENFGFSASHVRGEVTKSAPELMSYKLHTYVACVSSNLFCALFHAKYLGITYVHMLFYISINTISFIFVFSLFDSLCLEAVPVCKLKYFLKNSSSFYPYKCLFYRTLYVNFF